MKNYSSIRSVLRLLLLFCLTAWVFHAQAQTRIELDNLTWFGSDSLSPGTYTKPGSPSETIVSTIPVGGPPAVFCNSTFPGLNNNGQTLLGSGGKGFFESLNDYGGTYTLTRIYKVTPGKLTHMQVRMATIPQPWLKVSSISATIDGRSLGTADRSNSSWQQQQFLEGSQTWTPTSGLVSFVISITAPGGCHADEEILYVDQFYQVSSTILAADDTGATVTSNGGQSLANVLANDSLNSATPTLATVNLTQISSTDPKVTLNPASGAVTVAPGATGGVQKVVYQICEKANPTNCSQATVTLNVTLALGSITVNKALGGGGRINPADQFTVNLVDYYSRLVAGTGTTKGSGSTVTPGSGTTNPVVTVSADDGAYYVMSESMAAGSVSALSAYTTSISCQNNGSGGTIVDYVHAFTDIFYAYPGDLIVCTITNSSPPGKPTLRLSKALNGKRISDNDQFTVQLKQGTTVAASGTTAGSGSTIASGSGTTGAFGVTAGTAYTLNEAMAAGSDSNLGRYLATVSCQNNGAGGTVVSNVKALNDSLTLQAGDAVACTITNAAAVATLTVRQLVRSPLPVNLSPPFTFQYTGTNGWSIQPLTNNTKDSLVSSSAQTLSALNTDTMVGTTPPENRWNVAGGFSCTDTNAAISGNPATILATVKDFKITIPGRYVIAGANLRCTILLGHSTP